jgi:hypothetical protein
LSRFNPQGVQVSDSPSPVKGVPSSINPSTGFTKILLFLTMVISVGTNGLTLILNQGQNSVAPVVRMILMFILVALVGSGKKVFYFILSALLGFGGLLGLNFANALRFRATSPAPLFLGLSVAYILLALYFLYAGFTLGRSRNRSES